MKNGVGDVLADDCPCVLELERSRLSAYEKVQIGLDVVVLDSRIASLVVEVLGIFNFSEFCDSFSDSLLHQKVVHKHQAIIGTPAAFGG
jgi:hypothetical protein